MQHQTWNSLGGQAPSLVSLTRFRSFGRFTRAQAPSFTGETPVPPTLRLGVPAPYTSSVSTRCLVSAQATPSLRSGVAWADTTVSSSFLLLHGTTVADNIVVWCSDHQSESTCSTKHKTHSGDKPPRSSPSLAFARSVGSSGSDGGLTGATKHRTPPVGRGRRLVAPLPPSQPSSPKAVSATVLTSSHKGRLICARGTSPLARLCYRSSVEERWFGSAIQRRGRTQHYALSYCPRQKAVKPYLSAGA